MSQGRESEWMSWSWPREDEWDGFGVRVKAMKGEKSREGRQKVSVTVTESDTKLRPKLIACLLISPANDCHFLSQNGRERNPFHQFLTFTSWIIILIKSLNMEENSATCCVIIILKWHRSCSSRGPVRRLGLQLEGCWFESWQKTGRRG